MRQAEQLYYTAQAKIPDLKRQIEQQENNLSILLGRDPGPIVRGQAIADAPHPADVPVGLPSELLRLSLIHICVAEDDAQIAQFVSRLGKSSSLHSVKLVSTAVELLAGKNQRRFEITADFGQ